MNDPEQLITALKLAYRYHAMYDPDIGQDELTEALCTALCESIGDEGFQEFHREASESIGD